MNIGPAILGEPYGELYVQIDGSWLMAGDKYTILELGWAVYVARSAVPEEWLRLYGETRPASGDWSELSSADDILVTSHPVLVALALRAWWHVNGRPIATAPVVTIPALAEAVEEVRTREILNDFNLRYAGLVPGETRWVHGRRDGDNC